MSIGTPPDSGFSWDGFYRANVVDNKDLQYRGRVKVWIPDIMPEVDKTKGVWARPANNPVGGRNKEETGTDQYYQGSCLIPTVGSWVFIFFENGNPSQPYYFCSGEFGQSKVPVECQVGTQYWNKWVIFKSKKGHTIIISDDSGDERTEITGKKRQLSGTDVSGNAGSIFPITGNQSTILIDDRSGKEKILIEDYKGNYINLNSAKGTLDVQITGDLKIKATGKVYITGQQGIEIKADLPTSNVNIQSGLDTNVKSDMGNINLQTTIGSINEKAMQKINLESTLDTNIKAGTQLKLQSTTDMNLLAGTELKAQSTINMNLISGAAVNAQAIGAVSIGAGGVVGLGGTSIKVSAIPSTPFTPSSASIASPATPAGTATAAAVAVPNGDRVNPPAVAPPITDPIQPIRELIPPTIRINTKPPEKTT